MPTDSEGIPPLFRPPPFRGHRSQPGTKAPPEVVDGACLERDATRTAIRGE